MTRGDDDRGAYLAAVQRLTDLWAFVTRHATHDLAVAPGRAGMGAHIEDLQLLYQGALALPVPASCQRAHQAFLAAVAETINAYLLTSERRDDEDAHARLLEAMRAFTTWRVEVARLHRDPPRVRAP